MLTALAIAVGTFALTLTLAASNGANSYVNKVINDNFDPAELLVGKDEAIFGRGDNSKPQEYSGDYSISLSRAGASTQIKQLSDDDITKIKAISGVSRVRENITANLAYVTREGQKKLIGNAQAFSPYDKPDLLAGEIRRPLGDKNILLPEAYLTVLGFNSADDAIGKKISLAVSKPASTTLPKLNTKPEDNLVITDFTIEAVLKKPTAVQPGTELYMFIGLDDARALRDIATKDTTGFHKYTFVFTQVSGGEDASKLKAVQDELKKQGYVAQSVKDTQQTLTQFITVLQGIVAGFGAIAIIASVFGVINTMYISVLQRTREIGLMKALGMRKRDIGRLFRFEAAWIGFLGGSLGSLLAVSVGTALNPWITKQLSLGVGNKLLIFKPLEVIGLIIILMIVSILAGWLPSRKAAKLDPIEALRTE
ncbi:MAG: FtsX-like permease family protein [bacterium]